MSVAPEKQQVGRQFSDAARTYTEHARHQRIIADRLASCLRETHDEVQVVELGCGTGLLTSHLLERLPRAQVRALDIAPAMVEACRVRWAEQPRLTLVEADAESFAGGATYDLVASSCVVQWFEQRELLGGHLAAMLRPGGMAALAVPLGGTLGELAESVAQATGQAMPGLELGRAESYLSAFDGGEWRRVVAQQFDVVQWYASPREVVRGVQAIGARCAGQGGASHLGAGAMRAVMQRYQRAFGRDDGCVPATYRAMVLIAERS